MPKPCSGLSKRNVAAAQLVEASSLLTVQGDFEGFFFFCVEKAFLVFWVFVLFHPIFFAFPPLKRFRGTSPSFVLEKAFLSMLGVCVLVCVSTWIFHLFSLL